MKTFRIMNKGLKNQDIQDHEQGLKHQDIQDHEQRVEESRHPVS